MTAMIDEQRIPELLKHAKGRDRAAFDELVTASHGRLNEFVRRRIRPDLRERLGVDRLTNEILARAFESLERFTGADEDSWFAWLAGIAKNVVLKEIEALNRGRTFQIDREIASQELSPSRAMRREERLDRLREALGELSEDHREVIRLCRIEGLRIQSVAERMRRSPEAVKMLLSRALRELKERFGDTQSLHLPQSPLEDEGGGRER